MSNNTNNTKQNIFCLRITKAKTAEVPPTELTQTVSRNKGQNKDQRTILGNKKARKPRVYELGACRQKIKSVPNKK